MIFGNCLECNVEDCWGKIRECDSSCHAVWYNLGPKTKNGCSSQTGTVSQSDDENPLVLEMRKRPVGQPAHFGTCGTITGFPEA
jgi:hypothetical protein